MLHSKTLFTASIVGSAGGTGQNILFYDTSTKHIRYSTVTPVGQKNTYYYEERFQQVSNTTSTPMTYLQSPSNMPAGRYFLSSTLVLGGTSRGEVRFRFLSTDTVSRSTADYHVCFLPVAHLKMPCALSGISFLNSTGSHSLQWYIQAGGSGFIIGAGLAAVYIGPNE